MPLDVPDNRAEMKGLNTACPSKSCHLLVELLNIKCQNWKLPVSTVFAKLQAFIDITLYFI